MKIRTWPELAEWLYEDRFGDIGSCYAFFEMSDAPGIPNPIRYQERYIVSWQQIGVDARIILIYKERSGNLFAGILRPFSTLESFKKELYYFLEEDAHCSKRICMDEDFSAIALPPVHDDPATSWNTAEGLVPVSLSEFSTGAAKAALTGYGQPLFFRSSIGNWYHLMPLTIKQKGRTTIRLVFCAMIASKQSLFCYDASNDISVDALSAALEEFIKKEMGDKVYIRIAQAKKLGTIDNYGLTTEQFLQQLNTKFDISKQASDLISNILAYAENFDDSDDAIGFLASMLDDVEGIAVSREELMTIRFG